MDLRQVSMLSIPKGWPEPILRTQIRHHRMNKHCDSGKDPAQDQGLYYLPLIQQL